MRMHRLGRTGLYVSELCLGTMTYGGKGFWEVIGKLGLDDVAGQLRTAVDAGVNFIDTADIYHEGESERLLGAALRQLGLARDRLVIATKVRGRSGPGPNDAGLSRKHIFDAIDGSLARLGTDHVDLYQIHGVDPVTPLEETMTALADVVRAGKVRYVGFCNLPAWTAMKALAIAIAAPGLPRLKEWAYAGMMFDLTGAAVAHGVAGDPIAKIVTPLVLLALVAGSWALRPAGRVLGTIALPTAARG